MQVDGAIPDIGSRLRQARERLHLSLRDIADHTKIPVTTLDAIEHNDFARLPGGLFRRAFIKAFAKEVGLDANALASEYREPVEVDRAALAMTAAPARARSSDRRWIGIGVTCAAVIVVGWMVSISYQALRQRGENAAAARRVKTPDAASAAPAPPATELAARRRARTRRGGAADGDPRRASSLGRGARGRPTCDLSNHAARGAPDDRRKGRDRSPRRRRWRRDVCPERRRGTNAWPIRRRRVSAHHAGRRARVADAAVATLEWNRCAVTSTRAFWSRSRQPLEWPARQWSTSG